MKIKSKHIYGGLFVDKHFLTLENNEDLHVSTTDYHSYNTGDDYPVSQEVLDYWAGESGISNTEK